MMQIVLSRLTTEPLQNKIYHEKKAFFWQDMLASPLLNCEEGVADECWWNRLFNCMERDRVTGTVFFFSPLQVFIKDQNNRSKRRPVFTSVEKDRNSLSDQPTLLSHRPTLSTFISSAASDTFSPFYSLVLLRHPLFISCSLNCSPFLSCLPLILTSLNPYLLCLLQTICHTSHQYGHDKHT